MATRGRKPSISNGNKMIMLRKHCVIDENGALNVDKVSAEQACKEINKSFDPKPPMTVYNLIKFARRQKQNNSHNKNVILNTLPEDNSCKNEETPRSYDDEQNLLRVQNDILYKFIVREVSTSPFTVFHWPIEAVSFASRLPEEIQFMFGSLNRAFCGGFTAPDGSVSKNIHLYALGANVKGDFIPICQMSSEDASPSLFQRFFGENLRSSFPIPTLLTLDHNYNQLTAANSVFNMNLQYEDYIMSCLKCLTGQSDCRPRCLFSTNIRLLIAKLKRSESFQTIINRVVKDFYIWCLVLLSLQNDFIEFQNTLRKIFIIASSQYENSIFNKTYDKLTGGIKTNRINEMFNRTYLDSLNVSLKHMLETEKNPGINYNK